MAHLEERVRAVVGNELHGDGEDVLFVVRVGRAFAEVFVPIEVVRDRQELRERGVRTEAGLHFDVGRVLAGEILHDDVIADPLYLDGDVAVLVVARYVAFDSEKGEDVAFDGRLGRKGADRAQQKKQGKGEFFS